jgi:hypothetical protein
MFLKPKNVTPNFDPSMSSGGVAGSVTGTTYEEIADWRREAFTEPSPTENPVNLTPMEFRLPGEVGASAADVSIAELPATSAPHVTATRYGCDFDLECVIKWPFIVYE